MKAIMQRTYGGPEVLTLEDVERPAVGDGEVLVRVRAASVNPYDWHHLRGRPYLLRTQGGFRRPKETRCGVDLAGDVEEVGAGVGAFAVGDRVHGMRTGAFGELVRVPADRLAAMPSSMSYDEAAAMPMAALTALQGLRDVGGLASGMRVLVNGASGGVGTYAVQIAKAAGAEVSAVCSGRNVALVTSLGADRVIDYELGDFTRLPSAYDLILDCVSSRGLLACRRVLAPGGKVVVVGRARTGAWIDPLRMITKVLVASRVGRFDASFFLAKSSADDLASLGRLADAGRLRSVVERTHPLAEVAQALAHVGSGHTRGKVVITV